MAISAVAGFIGGGFSEAGGCWTVLPVSIAVLLFYFSVVVTRYAFGVMMF